jgi:putative oxidoreductase
MDQNSGIRILYGSYALFGRVTSWLQSPFLLAVRLYWGWQFVQTGWGKLHNLGHVTQFFTTLGIPAPHANAIFVSTVELVGGILLILGLASRLTGLVLAGDMVVAYIVADREALSSILSNPGKFYGADPYTFLFAALLVLIFGAGFFSLDRILEHAGPKKSGANSVSAMQTTGHANVA